MIVFHVIMYSQGYTSIHPHSTWMCHFWLSYSLLSLHLWSASPSPCWLLWVCIHTHRQIVEYSGSIVTWKRRGLKMKTCLKKQNKNAFPRLWKPSGSSPRLQSENKAQEEILPALRKECSRPANAWAHQQLTTSSCQNWIRLIWSTHRQHKDGVLPSLQHSHDSRKKKKKNPSRRSVCVTP